ncbi:MAG: hypothetical protein ACM3SW_18390 [Actinomycetota bacterium]
MITEHGPMVAVLLLIALFLTPATAQNDLRKHYGVISGTAYGPDDRPMYGVRVTIHRAGKGHHSWDLVSDHRGEFAQRVPPGPGEYVIHGEVEVAPIEKGVPNMHKKMKLKDETTVHIDNEEIEDVSLHMKEQPKRP